MGERLVPVYVDGPSLTAYLDNLYNRQELRRRRLRQAQPLDEEIPETSPGPVFAQCWVDAPEGMNPPPSLLPLMRVLAQFSYRPRWRFVLAHDPATVQGYTASEWLIHVHTWLEDAYHPGTWVAGHSLAYLPPLGWNSDDWPDDAEWVKFLHGYVIPRIEQHEQDEWFQFKGERPFDPHAKPSVADKAGWRGSSAVAAGGGGRGGNGGCGAGGGSSGVSAGGGAVVSNGSNGTGGCGGGGYVWPS